MSISRRHFNTGLLLSAGLLPSPVEAQTEDQFDPCVIGFMSTAATLEQEESKLIALRAGLAVNGFKEGRNIFVEYRFADGQYDLLEDYAIELVAMKVKLIIAAGGPISALAARDATTGAMHANQDPIPVVFTAPGDPVKLGLVKSLSHPSTHLTGVAGTGDLDPFRLEILQRAVPTMKSVAVLYNPHRPGVHAQLDQLRLTANHINVRLVPVAVLMSEDKNGNKIFNADTIAIVAAHGKVDAILVTADSLFMNNREAVVQAITTVKIPVIYPWKEFVMIGGLMSYGSDIMDAYAKVGEYSARILKGERPQELAVLTPTVQLDINNEEARRLGLSLNPRELLRGAGAGVRR